MSAPHLTEPPAIRRAIIHGAVAAVLGLGLFLTFVLGFPLAFRSVIEPAHPGHFAAHAMTAIQQGDMDRALRIVRHAAWFRTSDPDAFAACGAILLDLGRIDEAEAAFQTAIRQSVTPPPEYRPTERPFYHPSARLGLGKIEVDRGNPMGALAHFGWARAYEPLFADEYDAYAKMVYSTYASQHCWLPALELDEPSGPDLAAVPDRALLQLSNTVQGLQKWHLAEPVGHELLRRDSLQGEGHFLLGRAALMMGDGSQAAGFLGAAADLSHPDAPFFLGMALETRQDSSGAAEAYLKTPASSLYYPFSMAKAAALTTSPDDAPMDLLQWLKEPLSTPVVERPATYRDSGWHMQSIDLARARDECFPVLIEWERDDPMTAGLSVAPSGDASMVQGSLGLQIQWVLNSVMFSSFDEIHGETLPGWMIPERRFEPVLDGQIMRLVEEPEGGRFVRIASSSPDTAQRLCGAPILLNPGSGYVLAGRMRSPKARGMLGWQFADRQDRFHAAHQIFDQAYIYEWRWGAAYATPQLQWSAVRPQIGVQHPLGEADFDDILLFRVREPDGALRGR